MEMHLTTEKDHGKFTCDEKSPKLNIPDKEMGILISIAESIDINLLEFENTKDPNDFILCYTLRSAARNTTVTIQLSKYGDKFKYINGKYVLNTNDFQEFSIPVNKNYFFDLEIKSISNKPFNLEMFFEVKTL
jgi:hypothetical protein